MKAVILAVAAAVVLVAGGCGGGDDKTTAQTTTVTKTLTTTNPTGTASVTTHGRFKYPEAVTSNYMRSCTQNGQVKEAYCACTLDKLSNTVSTGDFARIGLSGGKIPARIKKLIRQAALDCADKL
ncbi:MAG: hypothetical protein ACJ74X_00680 [Gaiellaceae bacterium]